ncbi:hypothetical protein ANN_17002 [Periplaneta americana]|uniref:Uncharacterized protein n=1 Tax=Periplaneta americana TaxID=6978 RepID=A0ABQ8SRP3_PERAM|nr:hypothetical protein ANN_17002 [Periplaneta americana]
MAGLCEGGNEPPGSLKVISRRFALDYLTFALWLGKTSEKTQPGNQPKRERPLLVEPFSYGLDMAEGYRLAQ